MKKAAPAHCKLLTCLWLTILLAPAAGAQAPSKSQEDWLRYSNWEHRTNARHQLAPEPGKSSSGANPNSEANSNPNPNDPAKLPIPENPGSQTVDGVQPSIPGWAFQQPQQAQRSPQIIMGGDTLGQRPYQGMGAGFFSGYTPYSSGTSNWSPFRSSSGWSGAGGGMYPLGGQNQSRLGPEVIETGPSPASGNYFSPATGDPSASGNYYAGSTPWLVPLNVPNQQKSYWGPDGSPFRW